MSYYSLFIVFEMSYYSFFIPAKCSLGLIVCSLYNLLKKNIFIELEKNLFALCICLGIIICLSFITLICSLFFWLSICILKYLVCIPIIITITLLFNRYIVGNMWKNSIENTYAFLILGYMVCAILSGFYIDLIDIYKIIFSELCDINFNFSSRIIFIIVLIRVFAEKVIHENFCNMIKFLFHIICMCPALIFVLFFLVNIFLCFISYMCVTIYNIDLLDFYNYYWVLSSSNIDSVVNITGFGGGGMGGGPAGPDLPTIPFFIPDGDNDDLLVNAFIYKIFTQGLQGLPVDLSTSDPLMGYHFLQDVNKATVDSYLDPLSKYCLHYYQALSLGSLNRMDLIYPIDNLFNLPFHEQSQFQVVENALNYLKIPVAGTIGAIEADTLIQEKILTRDRLVEMLYISDTNTNQVRDRRYWELFFHFQAYAADNNLQTGLNPVVFINAVNKLEINLINQIKHTHLDYYDTYSGVNMDILNFYENFYGKFEMECMLISDNKLTGLIDARDIYDISKGDLNKVIENLTSNKGTTYNVKSNDISFLTNFNLLMLYEPLQHEYMFYLYEDAVIKSQSHILNLVYKLNPSPWGNMDIASISLPHSPSLSSSVPNSPSLSSTVQNSPILREVYAANNICLNLPLRTTSSIPPLSLAEDTSSGEGSSNLKRKFPFTE